MAGEAAKSEVGESAKEQLEGRNDKIEEHLGTS